VTEVADFLLEPWRSGLGQRALLEVALVGAIGGGLAFWVVTFGLSYGAESLAHGLLPGLVAAAILGVPLVAGAAAGIVAAAAATGVVGRDARLGVDTATAVAVTGMLGAGGLLALSQDAPPRLEDLLFGDPLSVGAADLAATGGLALVCGGGLIALHRPLVAVAFDAEAAGPLGVRRGAVLGALLALLAATLGIGVQGLGNLLVLAVLVAPAVAVRRHVRTPGRAVFAGASVAVVAGVAGLYASYHLEIAAGAGVALALCAAAVAGAALPARPPGVPREQGVRRVPG
jgi:ABC-type Mn2+/Zn2+ transport system permease subunit